MIDHILLVLSGAVSFLFAFVLTPLARDAFLRLGLVDRPDGKRKLHVSHVPRAGGIAITFAYVLTYGALLFVPWRHGPVFEQHFPSIVRLLPAATLIFTIGLVDDVFGLKPAQKLGGQVLAALLAIWGGVQIRGLAGFPLGEWMGPVATVIWLVGCANALNLIDGLDGLASGMGLFAALTSFLAALLQGNHMLALATLPLAGSLAGFLRYNFNPASVFLGDCGSLLIGFLLGCYGVIWSQKSATVLGMTAPLLALAIPLLDAVLAVVRRWLRGKPIFGADYQHIHHKLLERGLRHRDVVLVLYLAGGIFAALSLLQSLNLRQLGGAAVVLFCAVTWLGIRYLGYFEFGVAGRALFGGSLRKVLNGQILLHGMEHALARCRSVDECWKQVEDVVLQLGFTGIQARLGGRSYDIIRGETQACWQIRVPLPDRDYVNLWRGFGVPEQPGVVHQLVEMLHNRLAARLAALRCEQDIAAGGSSSPSRATADAPIEIAPAGFVKSEAR
jgi:UDP-GlcNAc:undecaprenyl-phosphate GlcNAc-1-phosphate transferase